MKRLLFSTLLLLLAASGAEAIPGDAWYRVARSASGFDLLIYVDARGATLGAYQLRIEHHPGPRAELDLMQGDLPGISAGRDGFVTVANTETPGTIVVNGIDPIGRPGRPRAHLLTLHFQGNPLGLGRPTITVDTLADVDGQPVARTQSRTRGR